MPLHVKTKVRLFNGGVKEAGQLVAGDELRSIFNTPLRVVGVGPVARGTGFQVTPRFSEPYKVGAGQLLPTVTEGEVNKKRHALLRKLPLVYGAHEVEELVRFQKKEKRRSKRPRQYRRPSEGAHPTEPMPLDPYILGSWLGDGSSCTLAITNQDQEVVKYWQMYFKDYQCRIVKKPNCLAHTYFFTEGRNSLTRRVLKAYNLINNKHIPEIFLQASAEVRMQVLAGLIDTDGYKATANSYEVVQVRERLARDIKELAQSLGFTVSHQIAAKQGKEYHRLFIMGRLKDVPVKVERKRVYKGQPEQSERWREEVEVTQCAKPIPMVKIKLEAPHQFFLADYVAMHGDESCD